jgi:hypothetical protein
VTDYPVRAFGGGKSLVLSSTSWMGGKNAFLGICYLCVGAVSLVLAFIFASAEKFGFVKRYGGVCLASHSLVSHASLQSGGGSGDHVVGQVNGVGVCVSMASTPAHF